MADVFIARTRQEIVDPANPPPQPKDPIRSDAPPPSAFTPAPDPVANASDAVIHALPPRQLPPEQGGHDPNAGTISIGSTEVAFAPNHGPVSNERGAGTIFLSNAPDPRAFLKHNNLPPPPAPVSQGSREMRVIGGHAPIQNPGSYIAHGPPRADVPITLPSPPPPQHTVTNERPDFSAAQPVQAQPEGVYIPPSPNAPPGVPQAPLGGVINVGGDVVIGTPGQQPPMNVQNDVRIGGGGDPTRQVRSEEVSIPGHPVCGVCGQYLVATAVGYQFCDHQRR